MIFVNPVVKTSDFVWMSTKLEDFLSVYKL